MSSFSCLHCYRLNPPEVDGTFMQQRNHYFDDRKTFGDDPDAFSFRCTFCRKELMKCFHCNFTSKSRVDYFKKTHWPQHYSVVAFDNDGEAATTNFSPRDEGDNNDEDDTAEVATTNFSPGDEGDDNDNDGDDISGGEEGSVVCDESSEDSSVVVIMDDMDNEFEVLAEEMLDLELSPPSQSNHDEMDIDDGTLDKGTHMWRRLSEFEKVFGRNSPAAIYFFHQAELFQKEANMTGGLRAIVHRCLAQHKTYGMSDPHTATRYFLLLKMLHSMPASSKQELMDYTCSIINMMLPNRIPNTPLPKFPKTMDEAKLMVIGPNNNTLKSNLPTEKIVNVDKNHAYVSLDNCIDTMMSNGIRPCFAQNEFGVRNTEGLNGCPFVEWQLDCIRSSLPNPDRTAIGWVSLWSDGYLTSYVKQRKNSAWIITMTVSEPFGKRAKEYTHIIGMGPSKTVSHDAVVLYALNETIMLRTVKRRFCGKTNTWIDTVFFLIFFLADRPERCELTYTSTWTGTCTKRFMWAAYIDRRFLPSCKDCYLHRIRILLGLTPRGGEERFCASCCDWSFQRAPNSPAWEKSSSDLGKIFGKTQSGQSKYPTEASRFNCTLSPFPSGRDLPEFSHLRPMQQLFENLRRAVTIGFEMVATNKWYSYNFSAYLKGCGLNQKAIDKAYAAAKAAREELKLINCAEARGARLTEMLDPAYLVSIGAMPGIWNIYGLDSYQFLELPMHMLLTGITKDLATLMENFMLSNSHSKPFERFINSLLDGLMLWQLDYVKVQSFPTKRYVSENFLALARLMPWIYSVYFRNWVPTNSGACVEDILKIQRLIFSGFIMISHLMREDEIPIDFIDDAIKVFLTSWDDLENAIGSLISNSMWSKGNHLSLMNLPSQIRIFGNLRWIWDGEKEKAIQRSKKLHKQLRHTLSYFVGKMNLHIQQKSIDIIQAHLIEAGDLPNGQQDSEQKKKSFQRYPVGKIEEIISNGLVLSCVVIQEAETYSVYAIESFRRDGLESLRRIDVNYQIGSVTSLGLLYTGFSLSNDVIEIQSDQLKEKAKPCLLLPFATIDQNFSGQFTLITDDWKILNVDGTIGYPKFIEDLFLFNV